MALKSISTQRKKMDEETRAKLETELRELWDKESYQEMTTLAIRSYGPEIYSYLFAILRNEPDASEVFADLCENLWKAIPAFRWKCSFRTWTYTLTRHSMARLQRDPMRKPDKAIPISRSPEVLQLMDKVRTNTLRYLRTETKDRFSQLREQLSPDEQTLFILRINRGMSWNEIARVLSDSPDPDSAEVQKQAGTLRKRYQRAKETLRDLARQQGLLS